MASSSMPTSEIEFLGEESTELSEVNDTDRDDVDSSYTSQFKQHNRSSLASSYFTFFYPCFFHLLKSSFLEKIRSTMGIIG